MPDRFLLDPEFMGRGLWGGHKLDGNDYNGCAIWPFEDAKNNIVEAWTARISGEILPEKFRKERGRRAGYLPDSVAGPDRLSIGREVESLSMVIASREVNPPFAIGLFGDWCVGNYCQDKGRFLHAEPTSGRQFNGEAQKMAV